MNAVEIEEAISELAEAPFDADEFPFLFLLAFGNKETTVRRLRAASNSDTPGAILQKSNIHLAVSPPGRVSETLTALRESPKTARNRCKFILATDGETLEAEDMATGEHFACPLPDLPNHFGALLPLAGISTVAQIKNNPIDIRATRHLNKLYIALLSENPDWDTPARRDDLNQFMARLIFCFFAEDTGIFFGENLFTRTLTQFSAPDSSNTHEVLSELFRAMDLPLDRRAKGEVKAWANAFPYVNGGLFAGTRDVPKFSKMARATLLAAGGLKWTEINPDIFGSMIQAVADELGMHYTSVPNIMKVLGPLFLDELNAALEEAGDNGRKLLNLRKRLARIRVFDPACGSGNFLVIAYIKMREIEQEIIRRRKDDAISVIKLTQFYGIEIKSFPAEIARLALLIAEFQCNVRMIGQREAILDILPLHQTGNIHCGNALRMDWLGVCPPPKGSPVEEDLAGPTGKLALDGSQAEDWETYICGNPPYKGSQTQESEQKEDLEKVFEGVQLNWKGLDYVAGWFAKSAKFSKRINCSFAFVSTNSICQGRAVSTLWPHLISNDLQIQFAFVSFKWANLASHAAGVTVVVVGLSSRNSAPKRIFVSGKNDALEIKETANINAYLIAGPDIYVNPRTSSLSELAEMAFGNMPIDGGGLSFSREEMEEMRRHPSYRGEYFRKLLGGAEFVRGQERFCLWIDESEVDSATEIPMVVERLKFVRAFRESSNREATKVLAETPYLFGWVSQTSNQPLVLFPRILSERREYVTVGYEPKGTLTTDQAYYLVDAPLWNIALIASRLHLVWIATVCGKLKTDFRYSNTLGWNTFPVPKLTETNKADLTRCAEDILLAREAHFPATIADLYEPDKMPENLRAAHERNDTVLEEIYIGRRFRNDTERLEKLFDMYTKMTKNGAA
jgi:N-6 DNA Methylase